MPIGVADMLGMSMRFAVVIDGYDLGSWTTCKGLSVTFKHEKVKELGEHTMNTWIPGWVEYPPVSLTRAMVASDWSKTKEWLQIIASAPWLATDNPVSEAVDAGGNASFALGSGGVEYGGGGGAGMALMGPSSGKIALFDSAFGEVAAWELQNVMPLAWKGPQLDATGKTVAIETLELVHEGFLVCAKFLKIFEYAAPYKFVLFDHNPEQLKITRTAVKLGSSFGQPSGGGQGAGGGNRGSSGPLARGNEPTKMTVTKARLVGVECKPMCDRLLGWLSPREMDTIEQFDLQYRRGGYITPVLLVQWGPPLMGFTFKALLTQVSIDYVRVSALGIPTHATVQMTLLEYPSTVPLTNPTSGGRPGRSRHVITSDESLMSIATSKFGTPGAWRAIAAVNGIDDPHSIRPGDAIYLPAPEELVELSGAN